MAGLARIAANSPPSWLTETRGQLSYPLNSENARPPGTFRSYLFWADRSLPARRVASAATAAMLLVPILVIAGFSREGDRTDSVSDREPGPLDYGTARVTFSRRCVKNVYRWLSFPLL